MKDYFLFVCSIKCTTGGLYSPPVVHFMLQTNRKSVQKK